MTTLFVEVAEDGVLNSSQSTVFLSTFSSSSTILNDLIDVAVTNLTPNEILLSLPDNTFINQTFAEAGLAEAVHSHVKADITDFSDDDYATFAQGALADTAIQASEKATINGVATLDGAGLVPANQLPAYVDDVIDVDTYAELPITGELSKIYVVIADETDNGKTNSYRWSGSVYVKISNNMSAAEIKSLYESNADTNVFTDAEQTKLSGIETGATADQTNAQIKTAYEANADTNAFTDAEQTQLADLAEAEILKHAMTKAEFFALSNKRKQDVVGSGSINMGRHHIAGNRIPVNNGITATTDVANVLYMGRDSGLGTSSTDQPVMIVAGIEITLKQNDTFYLNTFKFPEAPDGTETYDSAFGTYTKHANSFDAFSVVTADIKVITKRKDYAHVEVFFEKITDLDIVLPRGDTQFNEGSHNDVPTFELTASYLIPQGYSAFGDWDTVNVGRGRRWSTLPDNDKITYLQDPKNNIFLDENDELIQVRFRRLVIKGLGNNWDYPTTLSGSSNLAIGYQSSVAWLQPQCNSVIPTTYNAGGTIFYQRGHASNTSNTVDNSISTLSVTSTLAYEGRGYTIPICLVQRMNKGAYHPEFNSEGCARILNAGQTSSFEWNHINAVTMVNQQDCFDFNKVHSNSGLSTVSNTGRPSTDIFPYSDVIYAEQVEDLRTDSNKQSESAMKSAEIKRAIGGEIRGKASVPFTRVITALQTSTDSTASIVINPDTSGFSVADYCYIVSQDKTEILRVQLITVNTNADMRWDEARWGTFNRVNGETIHIIHETLITSEYETLPWQDIIGDPERIATTFPNGVYGQWIPVLPDGVISFPLNEDCLDTVTIAAGSQTLDDGATWASVTPAIDNQLNETTHGVARDANAVILYPYSVRANPYELADNSEVIGELGKVIMVNNNSSEFGAGVMGNLLGTVMTGSEWNGTVHGLNLNQYLLADTGEIQQSEQYSPIHSQALFVPTIGTPSGKAFPYITQENSQYYLQWVYKEMVWDTTKDEGTEFTNKAGSDTTLTVAGEFYHVTSGVNTGYWYCLTGTTVAFDSTAFSERGDGVLIHGTGTLEYYRRWDGNGFGDNNKFTIVDGEFTETDDNGNTILIGQKRVALPYFTGRNE